MGNQQDIIIQKLGEDLAKARLTLGKICAIIDKIPFWSADIAEIDGTLQKYFGDDKKVEVEE